jgi:hypothetical protein
MYCYLHLTSEPITWNLGAQMLTANYTVALGGLTSVLFLLALTIVDKMDRRGTHGIYYSRRPPAGVQFPIYYSIFFPVKRIHFYCKIQGENFYLPK